MAELIQEYSTQVRSPAGIVFIVRSYGEQRLDGTWEGWLTFTPVDGLTPPLRTDRETSQPNRITLEYWASGLEPIYLDGALERALALSMK